MEDTNEAVVTPEQQSDSATKDTPKQRRNKPMAQATIEQNGSMAPSQGGQGSRKAKLGLLPTASTAVEVNYRGKVIEETTWAQLPHNTVFSVNSDGSHPYLKLAKSRYLNLVTSDVVTSVPANAQQKVYRVSLT